jgi:hypothetical protein
MKFISAKQWIAVDAILESSLLPVEVSSSPPSLCSLSMCCDLLRCHHRSRDCVLIQMTFLRRRATSWYPPPASLSSLPFISSPSQRYHAYRRTWLAFLYQTDHLRPPASLPPALPSAARVVASTDLCRYLSEYL